MPTLELPLFPLTTVLFPGGRLDLRIFEPRYLDMVRDCMREGREFGVCLILQGREAGAPAKPAAFGTTARIVDFGSTPDGLLGICTRGERRFHVEQTRVRDNGLITGKVSYCEPDPELAVPAEYGLLATIMERVAEQVGGDLAATERAAFDNAAWVGWRLAELLPLEMTERQQLLQENDPVVRLKHLADWLPRFQKH